VRHVAVIAHSDKLRNRARRDLKRALHDAVPHVSWIVIEKGSAGTRAAKHARRDHPDVVVVAGGDGTVRAATQGLVHSGIPMAVLPVGTANLFASALGLPAHAADLVELIASGATRTLDTGTCNGMSFNIMGGTGFDAAVMDDAEAARERLGSLAYFRAGAREARNRQPFEMSVELDGTNVFEGMATGLVVGNIGTIKGGIQALPDASPTDGKLDLAVITAAGLRDWASLMLAAARHRQHSSGHALLWQGTSVIVRCDAKHRFELDGGVKGRARRFEFGIDPESLVVCAPADSG